MTTTDRTILRELAKQQMEIAQSDKNLERVRLWQKHAAFCGERPMLHIELGTFQQEIIPPLLRCEDPAARSLETGLYQNFVNLSLFDDDRVVPPYFPVSLPTYFLPFGYQVGRTVAADSTGGTLGHAFNHVIGDLREALPQLPPSVWGTNAAEMESVMALAQEAFGDILPVTQQMNALAASPTQSVVHMMGMENMYVAMVDYPDEFKELMRRLTDDYIASFKSLEAAGALLPTCSFQTLYQGSLCFTDELPTVGTLKTTDVWGYLDSQETVSISPEMFTEFIFPGYQKIAECFGLLSYGCCEPVHPVWPVIQTLPNLRKLSISPWCDQEMMGEQLRGRNIVFHRKPSPNFLGVGTTLDGDAVRAHINQTISAAKGCTLEISQRDVYTVNGSVEKVRAYVRIIRECIDKSV